MPSDQTDPIRPAVTQADLNAHLSQADAASVDQHISAPAPTTTTEKLDAMDTFLAALHTRLCQVEQAIGTVLPLGEAAAALLPGGGAASIAATVLDRIPALENTVNGIIAIISQEFGGKLAHQLPAPIAPTAVSGA